MGNFKSKVLLVCAVCAVAFSFASCSSVHSSETDSESTTTSATNGSADGIGEESMFSAELQMGTVRVNDDAEVTSLPPVQTDSKGNEITGVPVTNKAGNVVTNKQGSTVTAAVVTNASGDVETDASGSAVTEKVTIETDSEGNLAETDFGSGSEQVSGNGATYQYSRFVWVGQRSDVTESGEYMEFTFKIKDNAPNGNYKISFDESRDSTLEVINYKLEPLTYGFIDGYISVGADKPAEEAVPKDQNTMMFGITNACGKPGDTVVVYAKVYNNPGMYAYLQEIKFNCDVLEIVSTKTTGIL